MPTLKDIASRCDTSISTVSRVLNYDQSLSVSDQLKRAIFETAAELNYQPPRQRKKTDKQLHIGIIQWYDNLQEIDDPYYLDIRKGIEQHAAKKGVKTTLIYKTEGSFNLDQLVEIDGLICVGKFSDKQVQKFTKITENIVFVDSSPDVSRFDSVVIDFKKAVSEIADVVVASGHTNIGYIGGTEEVDHALYLGERREIVFKERLKTHKRFNPTHFHSGSFSLDSGYEIMREILQSQDFASVYFCANDSIAMGALRAIHERGLSIPNDIAIIGFNDSSMSAYMSPPLTTVKVYTMLLGEEALESILERIKRRLIPIRKIVPTTLIYRTSFKKGMK
jgi:LacI family transcriptional regulator